MSKSKAGKKAKDKKLKKRKVGPAPKLAKKAKRKATHRAPQAVQVPQQSAPVEPPEAVSSAPTEAACGHLDAPSAGAHPGEGHQSVVRSEVKS